MEHFKNNNTTKAFLPNHITLFVVLILFLLIEREHPSLVGTLNVPHKASHGKQSYNFLQSKHLTRDYMHVRIPSALVSDNA